MSTTSELFNNHDAATPGYHKPANTALLLLDFHGMFVDKMGGPQAKKAVNIAADLRKWAMSNGIHVVHCLIDVDSTPSSTCRGAEMLRSTLNAMRLDGSHEPQCLSEPPRGKDEVIFTRRVGLVSALKSPGLDEYLVEKGIKSLVLTGLSTSGCVTRTALAATDADYVVTTIEDGCADGKEGVHEVMLTQILNNRGYVMTAAHFKEGYGKVFGKTD